LSEPRPEVAAVIAQAADAYEARYPVSRGERRILTDLVRCRTAALGGHKQQCTQCGHEVIAWNSCRNRHCPKCQGPARARWLEARSREVLPVQYFHLVFTLPRQVSALALQNKRLIYGMLFRATASTLRTIGRDPRHLGAETGFLAVLHTWGQTLEHHAHLHCVVPGGGIGGDGSWIAARPNFFLPVRVLSRYFRRAFLRLLRAAYHEKKLRCRGSHARLADPAEWGPWLRELECRDWVVYAKPPFGGPQQVLKYLARYTHRVAISNQRLVSVADGKVSFRWKDYAHGSRECTMTLDAVEFLRRFLMHRLPPGFHHIRQYGFLGNRNRTAALAQIRSSLNEPSMLEEIAEDGREAAADSSQASACPQCKNGKLVLIALLPPLPVTTTTNSPVPCDTS
jgi:hypothetical protein